tara:strand:- start:1298 stop:1663 length:366 start_codon:yes stop_codon:yes gene_type:complete
MAFGLNSRAARARAGLQLLDALGRSMAMIEFDLDGKILNANENFLKTMGYTLPEIVGKHHSMFVPQSIVSDPSYKEFWGKLRAGEFAAGAFQRVLFSGCARIRKRSGWKQPIIRFSMIVEN